MIGKENRVIDAGGICYMRPVELSGERWFYCADFPQGDLYEAEEMFRDGRPVRGTRLYLYRYPSGERFEPLGARDGVYIGDPVCDEEKIYILSVDFPENRIMIDCFDCGTKEVSRTAEMDLGVTEDCYNLMLNVRPVTLTRQPNDGTFQVLWPEKTSFRTGLRESFFYRDGDSLYFSRWFEDPDYREETVVRDISDGHITAVFPGGMSVMPGGEKWFLG